MKRSKIMEDLSEYRLDHGLTQEQLAVKVGVTYSTLSRWLNGKQAPMPLQEHRIKKLLAGKRMKSHG